MKCRINSALGFLLFLTRASESHHLAEKMNSKMKKKILNEKLLSVLQALSYSVQIYRTLQKTLEKKTRDGLQLWIYTHGFCLLCDLMSFQI